MILNLVYFLKLGLRGIGPDASKIRLKQITLSFLPYCFNSSAALENFHVSLEDIFVGSQVCLVY